VFAFLVLAFPVSAGAQVLDLGGGGSFSGSITPTNAGRAAGWFWDNISADGQASQCNAGYFADGSMDAGCANQAPGTFANQGGYSGGTFWQSGPNPAPFMFSGSEGYRLTLVGSLAGGISEFGTFTRQPDGIGGWTYTFNAVPSFGSKLVGSTYLMSPGADWGFYIRNQFNPATGGCATTADCSDATGGYLTSPFNQFVLMRSPDLSAGKYRYLVGAEDNALFLLPNGSWYDSDYNDYLVEVTVTPEPLSMALVATGLLGMSGIGLIERRRRRKS
jgi:hypothetical protein